MAYPINLTNGNLLVTLADGETNTSACSLTLIGRNVSTYGESVNEDLVHLLENAANTVAPNNPTPGQLWYNTGSDTLSVRTTGNTWTNLATYTKSASTPSGIVAGEPVVLQLALVERDLFVGGLHALLRSLVRGIRTIR